MQGPLSLQASVTIPPGPPGFLQRVKIDGEFAIAQGHFTNPKTQTPLNRLSASAEGQSKRELMDNATLAPIDIHGNLSDRDGLARLQKIVFDVPGIHGQLAGTFALERQEINMSGVLETRGNLADTESGVKALMLKAMGTFWPGKASIRSIPFGINGKASHPVFRLRLRQNSQKSY
jgi:hypothetical protein